MQARLVLGPAYLPGEGLRGGDSSAGLMDLEGALAKELLQTGAKLFREVRTYTINYIDKTLLFNGRKL